MTQVKHAQAARSEVALRKRAGERTLAERRADLEAQVREYLGTDALMALTDLAQVRDRLHVLHQRLERHEGRKITQYEIAEAIDVPHRTFQSWEGGEVETTGENYQRIADFYSLRLGERITKNWVLFGQDEEPPLQLAGGATNGDGAISTAERLARIEEQLVELRTDLAELGVDLARDKAQEQKWSKRTLGERSREPSG